MSTMNELHNYSSTYNSTKSSNTTLDASKSNATTGGSLFEIGRPCILPEKIDPKARICNLIRTKMCTLDLIPCRYSINLAQTASASDLSGLIPHIEYKDAVDEFGEDCLAYGLPKKFVGLRLLTTDDTQANDAIMNSRGGKNFFQGLADTANDLFSPISSFAASTGTQNLPQSAAATSQLGSALGAAAGGVAGMIGDGNLRENVTRATESLTQKLADSAINGYRYSFPSIWSDSSYSPNITTNLKLLSPYGHPDAIRKFIIEPLMYLIILASPKTKDGMAYGRPHSITLRAYGLSYVPLAAISSIHLRRGGDGTNFNLYGQPTSVDVAIEFEALVGGFATYTIMDKASKKSNANSKTAFNSNKFITEFANTEQMSSPTLTTLEHIVESLRPVPPGADVTSHVFIGADSEEDKGTFPTSLDNVVNTTIGKVVDNTSSGVNKLANNITAGGSSIGAAYSAGQSAVSSANSAVSTFTTKMNDVVPGILASPSNNELTSKVLATQASGKQIVTQIVNNIKRDSNPVQAYVNQVKQTQELLRQREFNTANLGQYQGPTGSSGLGYGPDSSGTLTPININPREILPGSIEYFDKLTPIEQQALRNVSMNADSISYNTEKSLLASASQNSIVYNTGKSLINTASQMPISITGTMGPGTNLSGMGSDNITYVGDLMNIPEHYDRIDPTKVYPITDKIELNELHELNFA